MSTTGRNNGDTRALGLHLAKFVGKHPGPRYSIAEVQDANRLLVPNLLAFLETSKTSRRRVNIASCLDCSLPQNLLKLLEFLLPGLPSASAVQPRKDAVRLYALILSALDLVVKDAAYQKESQAAEGAVHELCTLLQQPGPDGAPGEQLQLTRAPSYGPLCR
jgi:hypothetical protein